MSARRISRSLTALARTVLGPSAVVRYGIRDFYEDTEPQRLFVIDVNTLVQNCTIEMVARPRPSRARRRRLLRAMRAALLASQRLETPDWTGWHDGHSWLNHPAHVLGDKAAEIYTSHGGPYEPLGVTFLEGRLSPHARFWGVPSAEATALAMVRAMFPPERMRRLGLAYERKLELEAVRREQHERWCRENPEEAKAEAAMRAAIVSGLFSRDVQ